MRRSAALALAALLALQAASAEPEEPTHALLRVWSEALTPGAPLLRERREAVRQGRLELERVRREQRPSWTLQPAGTARFDGAWETELTGSLEVPVHEPALERREQEARARLDLARLNERLAARDARTGLWSDLIAWRRVTRTLALVHQADRALRRLPPPRPDAAEQWSAWSRFGEELELESALLGERLRERTGLDPRERAVPALLSDGGLAALRRERSAHDLDACIERDGRVLRARHALRTAERERSGAVSRRARIALSLQGTLRLSDGDGPALPSLDAGASVRIDVGLPPGAAVNGGGELLMAGDRVRVGARLSGPVAAAAAPPSPRRAALDVEEARFEAGIRLRRAALEQRQLREILSGASVTRTGPARRAPDRERADPEARLAQSVARAREPAEVLQALDGAVAELTHRSRLAHVTVEIAATCAPP